MMKFYTIDVIRWS